MMSGLCRLEMLDFSILFFALQVLARALHFQIIFAGICHLVHCVPRPLKQLVESLERSAGRILSRLLALAGVESGRQCILLA